MSSDAAARAERLGVTNDPRWAGYVAASGVVPGSGVGRAGQPATMGGYAPPPNAQAQPVSAYVQPATAPPPVAVAAAPAAPAEPEYSVIFRIDAGDLLTFCHYYAKHTSATGQEYIILGVDRARPIVSQFAPKPGDTVKILLTDTETDGKNVRSEYNVAPTGMSFPIGNYTLTLFLVR